MHSATIVVFIKVDCHNNHNKYHVLLLHKNCNQLLLNSWTGNLFTPIFSTTADQCRSYNSTELNSYRTFKAKVIMAQRKKFIFGNSSTEVA
jgi:hypothetical protein